MVFGKSFLETIPKARHIFRASMSCPGTQQTSLFFRQRPDNGYGGGRGGQRQSVPFIFEQNHRLLGQLPGCSFACRQKKTFCLGTFRSIWMLEESESEFQPKNAAHCLIHFFHCHLPFLHQSGQVLVVTT